MARRIGVGDLIRLGLGFANLKPRLAEIGGFLRIHSGLEVSWLQKIAPTCVTILGTLATFELQHAGLGTLSTLDH